MNTQALPIGRAAQPFRHAQQGLPTLGVLVWWSLPASLELSLPEIEQKLFSAGLPVSLVPRVQARGALSKALQRLESGNLVRRITEDSEKVVLALVAEEVDAQALEVDYEQVQTVTLNKTSKSLEFSSGAHADQIRDLFARFSSTLTAGQVRTLIRRALDVAHPIPVRPGLFFVGRDHEVRAESLAKFVDSLSPDSSLGTLGIVDSRQTRATMLRIVREDLEAEIDRAQEGLDSALADSGTRATTLARRLEVFRKVRAKVSGYSELLEFSVRDLQEKLRGLEDRVKQAL
tara:strand:+ start:3765 stop:4631 length:867 start_codon:yes stop_codon:yes gene_type:complete